MIVLTAHPEGTVVAVHAQPGARKNGVVGEHGGALKVAVSAPPERGRANDAIAKVLAEALGCRTSSITLISGASSREKKIPGRLDDSRRGFAKARRTRRQREQEVTASATPRVPYDGFAVARDRSATESPSLREVP
jgi:uncharacterized protein (TIGR00251 family)